MMLSVILALTMVAAGTGASGRLGRASPSWRNRHSLSNKLPGKTLSLMASTALSSFRWIQLAPGIDSSPSGAGASREAAGMRLYAIGVRSLPLHNVMMTSGIWSGSGDARKVDARGVEENAQDEWASGLT
jgi:hypothetical protein